MREIFLDEVEQAHEDFRDKLNRYIDYLHYLEAKRADKLTAGEREILKKHGQRKNKKRS